MEEYEQELDRWYYNLKTVVGRLQSNFEERLAKLEK